MTDILPAEIVRRIRSAGDPERIVLFGSRARGEARPASDYDLLIVQQSGKPRYERAGAYYRVLSDLPVEVDIVVFTPEETDDWQHVPQAFVTTALREGLILYEREA